MIFRGLSSTFSTKGADQYNTIGKFWDCMSSIYGMENLRGLGYNWTENTIEYVIGLKSNESINIDQIELEKMCVNAVYKEISIPQLGWERYEGKTDELQNIYNEIYLKGPLIYEIEQFSDDGSCVIEYVRK